MLYLDPRIKLISADFITTSNIIYCTQSRHLVSQFVIYVWYVNTIFYKGPLQIDRPPQCFLLGIFPDTLEVSYHRSDSQKWVGSLMTNCPWTKMGVQKGYGLFRKHLCADYSHKPSLFFPSTQLWNKDLTFMSIKYLMVIELLKYN